MAATATPVPIRQHNNTFFELSHKKRKQRRIHEQEQRQRALLEAEQEEQQSRSQAWDYIFAFLQASEWCEQMDQITVVYEAVPLMDELESYGSLDEKEGTRVCRKLFKAPVVWDALGRGLWKVLAEQRQKSASPDTSKDVTWKNSFDEAAEISPNPVTVNSSRRPSARRSSVDSCSDAGSQGSVSPRMSFSSSPSRHGSIPKIFSRITARRLTGQ